MIMSLNFNLGGGMYIEKISSIELIRIQNIFFLYFEKIGGE